MCIYLRGFHSEDLVLYPPFRSHLTSDGSQCCLFCMQPATEDCYRQFCRFLIVSFAFHGTLAEQQLVVFHKCFRLVSCFLWNFRVTSSARRMRVMELSNGLAPACLELCYYNTRCTSLACPYLLRSTFVLHGKILGLRSSWGFIRSAVKEHDCHQQYPSGHLSWWSGPFGRLLKITRAGARTSAPWTFEL